MSFHMEEKMIYKHDFSAQRATGIGLAAGLGGGAILLGLAGLWGLNKASEARSAGATQSIAGLTAAMAGITGQIRDNRQAIENRMDSERQCREAWQNSMTPSIQSYIDIQANPNQSTTAAATAEALALAAAINNNGGINSAIGTDSFLKVARYSAPQPCGCDTCNG